MSERIDIGVPDHLPADKIISVIERTILGLGLNVMMRGTLKTFPGSTHWHTKRGRGRGTLEITWWPTERKLWIKIQAGRTAAWIEEIAPRLKNQVESLLNRLAHSSEPRKKGASRR